MLTVSVNVLFRVGSGFDDLKDISDTLLKILGMSIDEIAKELTSKI